MGYRNYEEAGEELVRLVKEYAKEHNLTMGQAVDEMFEKVRGDNNGKTRRNATRKT